MSALVAAQAPQMGQQGFDFVRNSTEQLSASLSAEGAAEEPASKGYALLLGAGLPLPAKRPPAQLQLASEGTRFENPHTRVSHSTGESPSLPLAFCTIPFS